ncbi:hypothetical protein [Falsirhodobacter xinxiangensis]|uniref:hypothetical protein n=1 Tax=Falsirhodobacter xinxiangensis TaxID=2530049 RepID=UPI0010A9E054|nr:hypothetical protein [Rhodobacter xinxiangensis]
MTLQSTPTELDLARRMMAANRLGAAIADCHPDDACAIMAATLSDLTAGAPIAAVVDATEDAQFWADMATPIEIEAYLRACLLRMDDMAVALGEWKRMMMALWLSFSPEDQASFLRRVTPEVSD